MAIKEKMNFKDFQVRSTRTMNINYTSKEALSNYGMGLCGEAGEAIDKLKKFIFHGHELDIKEIAKELGDVLWYVSALATTLDIELEEIAELNINKLIRRYPEGFNSKASIERIDLKFNNINNDEAIKKFEEGLTNNDNMKNLGMKK